MRRIVLYLFILIPYIDYAQGKWEAVTSNPYCSFDDIAMAPNGDIFAAVYGRDIILQSLDKGLSWNRVPRNENFYNGFSWIRKLAFYYNTLFQINDRGIIVSQMLSKDKFILDTIHKCIQLIDREPLIYDKNGHYITSIFNDIYVYDSSWCNFKIIKLPKPCMKLFIYKNSSYGLIYQNYTYQFVKLDLNNYSYNYVSDLITNVSDIQKLYVSPNGTIYVGETGLYRSTDGGLNYNLVTMDVSHNPNDTVLAIYESINHEIFIQTVNNWYYSNNDGIDFKVLHNFKKNFPEDISKMVIKDSSYAIALSTIDCDRNEMFLLRGIEGWKKQTSDVKSYFITSLSKLSDHRLTADFNQCNQLKYSVNDGRDWANFLIENQHVSKIENINSNTDLAITENNKLYITINQCLDWKEITPSNSSGNSLVKYFSWGEILYYNVAGNLGTFYKSYDFGESWVKKEIILDVNLPYFSEDLNQTIVRYSHNSGDVFKSIDGGFTWALDQRFNGKFRQIWDLKIEADGMILLTAIDVANKLGLYYSINNSNFNLLSSELTNSYFVIFDKFYPEVILKSHEQGILRVDTRTGKITAKYNEGIPSASNRMVILGDLLWDKSDELYLSVMWDNLYKNEKKITLLHEENPKTQNYPNLFYNNKNLMIYAENIPENSIELRLVVSDVLGREVYNKNINTIELMKGILLPKFIDGIYVFGLQSVTSKWNYSAKIMIHKN